MSIFDRLFNKRRMMPDGETGVFPFSVYSSLPENNPTVQACITKIANTLSELPLNLYVKKKGGGRGKAYFNSLYDIAQNPSTEETPTLFYSTMIRQLLITGNAFIYINRTGKDITGFTLVDSTKVVVKRDSVGRKFFEIDSKAYTDRDILHIPYPLGYNGTLGRSPIKVASDLIALDNELLQYIGTFFRNSIGTRMTLKLTGKYQGMNQVQAYTEIVPLINKFVTGANNAGKAMVIPADTEVGKIELPSNSESELTSLMISVEKQIAQIFNVPYSLISEENKYGSFEITKLNFLQECIQPLGNHIAESFNKLLMPQDRAIQYFAYNYKALLETDTKSTIDYLAKEIFSGMLTINEARQRMDMDSIGEEGDIHLMPSAYYPLTMDNINAFFAQQKAVLAGSNKSSVTD